MRRVGEDRRARFIRLSEERARRRLERERERQRTLTKQHAKIVRNVDHTPASVKAFSKVGRKLSLRILGEAARVRCPEVFSFIDNPQESLDTAGQFARAIEEKHKVIAFEQSQTRQIDLCAAAVVNVIAKESVGFGRRNFRGSFPSDPDLMEIVTATGLPQTLGIVGPPPPNFKIMPPRYGRGTSVKGRSESPVENDSEAVAEYFIECFKEFARPLTEAAETLMALGIGEILTNADEHSGGQQWYAFAYLRRQKGKGFGDCHLVVFNLGPSMADTLRRLPEKAMLRRDIEGLVRLHRGPRILPNFVDETLWTILALQDGVSVKNTETEPPLDHRGVGTVRMIEMFQRLGKTAGAVEQPRMCVISGHTHVLLDGRYPLKEELTENGETRSIIAFNTENELRIPPDTSVVTHLKRPFPGTLISMRFFIDPKYLDTL